MVEAPAFRSASTSSRAPLPSLRLVHSLVGATTGHRGAMATKNRTRKRAVRVSLSAGFKEGRRYATRRSSRVQSVAVLGARNRSSRTGRWSRTRSPGRRSLGRADWTTFCRRLRGRRWPAGCGFRAPVADRDSASSRAAVGISVDVGCEDRPAPRGTTSISGCCAVPSGWLRASR